ncbi:MAG: YeeE/YedE thiosulfate transporter family protein [Desulfuromonadaceae bacterium]|nr:YeeE/YedE thiosulfate transporter family protein [Desulfuromonadaceae bacterium]
MLKQMRTNKRLQLLLGFLMGIFFGFFLQKGQVTRYDVLMGQLLLTDFTVVKVILTAILVGMLGIYPLKWYGLVTFHVKEGSLGSSGIGSLIFGIGFALLGYCPGTAVGAVGQGSLDALLGGIPGIMVGAAIYSVIYPIVRDKFQPLGNFGKITLPELFKVGEKKAVLAVSVLIIFVLSVLELVAF